MTKRQILYAVLGFIATMILIMIAGVAVLLLTKPEAKIIWTDAQKKEAQKAVAKKGKWEGKEKVAISKVAAVKVDAPPTEEDKKKRRKPEEVPKISLAQLAEAGWFEETFKTENLEAAGWQASWAKDAWYFVSYNRKDGLVNVGPTWLVNLKTGRILPKNAMARAGMAPGAADASDHFDRERQVIGSIANHNFESGVTLGGVMLIHFSELERSSDSDRIVGWTIVHDYGDAYRAYFQWIEDGEATYADFEFDYSKKALRSRNLQAANLMNIGGDFEPTERVSIMPASYNPEAPIASDRWLGKSRKACKSRGNAARCRALAKVLQDQALIESVEWLLTTRAGDASKFSSCKTDRRCKWTPRVKKAGVFEVEYSYELGGDEKGGKATWLIDVKKNQITPQDELAEMAFLAVHPRRL
jgi:hypothetical protein